MVIKGSYIIVRTLVLCREGYLHFRLVHGLAIASLSVKGHTGRLTMMVLSLFQWDKLNNHVALNLASTVHKHVAKGAN